MAVGHDHGIEVVCLAEVVDEGARVDEDAHVRHLDEQAGVSEVGDPHGPTVGRAGGRAALSRPPTLAGDLVDEVRGGAQVGGQHHPSWAAVPPGAAHLVGEEDGGVDRGG